MTNVNDHSPQINGFLAQHAESLDALVRDSPAARRPLEAYPGPHPCEIKGCTANAPFGLAALPRRVWFCRKHWEEIQCLTQPIQSRPSKPSVGPEPASGEKGRSPPAATAGSDTQLTLFNNGL